MGFDEVRTSLVIPTLITRRYVPKDDDISHISTIVGEKNDVAFLGFTNKCLNGKKVFDFPEDLLRNCLAHVYPATKGNHVENTILLPETPLDQHTTIVEPDTGETWILMRHILPLPLRGASQPLDSCNY